MERFGQVAPSSLDERMLIEAVTGYAICMLDPGGTVATWTPGARLIMGYERDEIVGKHFSGFYTDDDQKAGLPARALEIAGRDDVFECEGWRIRKGGGRFCAHVVVNPIRQPSREIVGFVKITRDITEQRVAEDALRQSQEQFRLLVRGVIDYAIFLLDKEGRVSNWNLGAQRIKGYLVHEILGCHFSKFYTEEDRTAGKPQKALETAMKEGRFESEGWRVRKDGSHFWAHVVIDPVRDDRGDLVGFAKITRDITERREAQQKLEKTRDALFQSQKMDAIGQLTGGIAHDFNNLLMAVLGSLDLMRKRLPNDPKIMALLENASQAAQRGTTLTKRMLAFARRQELKYEAVDIPALVTGMADLLRRTLGPSIGIDTNFPPAMKAVLADANQLELALLNLSVNARDAMPAGGRVSISAREEAIANGDSSPLKPGTYVCVSVSDTGTGMDEQTLRRAIEPFFTTKGPGKGTGLGLSMVDGLAEQSRGRFFLKSRIGEGTTAELWLPVAEPRTVAAYERETFAHRVPVDHSSLMIVVVDDDRLVLTSTAAMLEDLGHKSLPASSGVEALRILQGEGSVDLVITDYAMPHMTGLQLAQVINREWPNIPVILATGYAEIKPGAEMKVSKISKPFTQAELAAELERTLPLARHAPH